MRILTSLIGLCLLFISQTYAQQPDNGSDTSRDISISGFVSPGYHYRTIQQSNVRDSLKPFYDSILNRRDDYESGAIRLSGGISLNYHYSQDFHLQTGLWYSQEGFNFKQDDFADSIDLTTNKADFKVHYLSIPIVLKFRVIDNDKWDLWLNPGILNQFVLTAKQDQTLEFNDGSTEERTSDFTSQMTMFNFSLFGAASLHYQLNEQVSLFARPNGKIMIGPARNASIEDYYYSLNLAIGAKYDF